MTVVFIFCSNKEVSKIKKKKEKIAMFVIGAATGSFVTWRIIKSKYELVENGEITVYPAEEKDTEEPEETIDENPETEDNDGEPVFSAEEKKEGEKVVKDLKYRTYSNGGGKKKRKKSDDDDEEMVPYVISPDDVGDTGYDLVNLTLYSNGVLVDDLDDEVIEDAELLIGNYAIDRIGEYEPDIIHVRNDELQREYEICRVDEEYEAMEE